MYSSKMSTPETAVFTTNQKISCILQNDDRYIVMFNLNHWVVLLRVRPLLPPVFDYFHYANTEGKDLGVLVTCSNIT